MELEHFFNENLNLKNLTHCAIANKICHERYGNLPPIPVIIWCYWCIYGIIGSNKSQKSAENGGDNNWNGPISSRVCDVTIIGTSWVDQPRGHWLNFCLISQISKCKLIFWTLFQLSYFTNPTMHLFHIPQCTIQNRNVHISVLNGALWYVELVHCGIFETSLLLSRSNTCRPVYPCVYWFVLPVPLPLDTTPHGVSSSPGRITKKKNTAIESFTR